MFFNGVHVFLPCSSKLNHYETKVIAFEIGTRGGLTNDNVKWLTDIHKQHFIENINVKTTLGSYYIYTARKHQSWSNTSYINPHT